jgi:septum formation protein
MMKNAGLNFKVIKPMLDEMAVIHSMMNHNETKEKLTPAIIAMELAKKKALAVSRKNPDALVIGSDQVLVAEGRMISKAHNKTEAKEKLKFLRGKTHSLISAVTVAKAETIFWSHQSEARLTMHDFDDAFLEAYCGVADDALTRAVGAYEIEGPGAWLFSEVKGDQFTVMGMPLLPLLGYLHEYHGVIP